MLASRRYIKHPICSAKLLEPHIEHTNDNIFAAMQDLRCPVYATTKIDGIRGEKTDDLKSRRLKMIPNVSIRRRAMIIPCGFDMELADTSISFDEIESIVMSEEHEQADRIDFHLIDNWVIQGGYLDRIEAAILLIDINKLPIKYEYPVKCNNPQELMDFFLKIESEHGEGICFRTPDSPYKEGYSTLDEQYLVKLCRFIRTEVTIIGFEEQMMNTASAKRNAVGMMDRTKSKEMKFGKNTLGKFLVRDSNGLEFKVGTGVGLTDARRREIWDNRDKYINQTITIKSKGHGVKVKPRSPVYIGMRKDNQ